MYKHKHGLILGFHGCDLSVRNKIVSGKDKLRDSKNSYDWLGSGTYFWEHNPARALEYAKILKKNPDMCNSDINKPAVLGAVIDLGYCLDLLNTDFIELVKMSFHTYKKLQEELGYPMIENKSVGNSKDLLLRYLDCAVINEIHKINKKHGEKDFDTVRGVFVEGEQLYPSSGFREKNHIQICVRNPKCIKGYFIPEGY